MRLKTKNSLKEITLNNNNDNNAYFLFSLIY